MEFTTQLELHSQATRLGEDAPYATMDQARTGLSPSMTCRSRQLVPVSSLAIASIDYNSDACAHDLQLELVPVHSPLLRESLLVSFPPLSNMLKSSGSSYLISGPSCNLGLQKGGDYGHHKIALRGKPRPSAAQCPRRADGARSPRPDTL